MTDSDTPTPASRSPKLSTAKPMSTLIDSTTFPHNPSYEDDPLANYLPPPSSTPTFCVAILTSGRPVWEMMRATLEAEKDPRVTVIGKPNGPYMDQGRNELMIHFYRNPALGEWLVFVDDDVADWTVDHLVELTRHGHHIVGGAYSSPHNGEQFIVAYNWGDGVHGPHTLIDMTVPELDALPPTPQPIAAIGTGFLAIHRSVVEAFPHYYDPPQPWFAELTLIPPDSTGDITTGIHLGEDLTFCLRANALGIPVHIHPAVRLTHYKMLGITLPPHPSLAG